MNNSGPITKDGRHPMGGTTVYAYGTPGAARESAPKPAQLDAKKINGAPITKPQDSSAALAYASDAETKTTGSTAAEQLYPRRLGLRGSIA